jgi:hypothetical protein
MDRAALRKLEKAEKLLGEAMSILKELRGEESTLPVERKATTIEFDAKAFLEEIKSGEREAAETALAELKQNQLGSIFGLAGGPPNDKKKPKNWLIEQILWRVFDFQRGQSTIRDEFGKKAN